jgi:hypothetical protein
MAMRGAAARLALAAAAMAVGAGVAVADVVRLRDGDLLEGAATDLGEAVRVETRGGPVELPWSRVSLIDREGSAAGVLREKRAALRDDDARGLFALALWCDRHGLAADARALHERVVALDPAHEASRAALGQIRDASDPKWKSGKEGMEARGFVHHAGRWMLAPEAEALRRQADAKRAATEEEKRAAGLLESLGDANARVRSYALEAMASVAPDLRRRLWLVGLRHRRAEVRRAAAAGLALPGDEGVVRSLLRSSVHDPDAAVRAAAGDALRVVAHADAVRPLVRALGSAEPRVRMNAADALGRLGNGVAVRNLVQRVHWVAGPSNRANIQVLNQVSYIRDFDVEIAQLAQIGDPIIGLLQDGVALDFKVFGAEGWETRIERMAYDGALERLTGKSFDGDGAKWAKWWEDEGRAKYGSLDPDGEIVAAAK